MPKFLALKSIALREAKRKKEARQIVSAVRNAFKGQVRQKETVSHSSAIKAVRNAFKSKTHQNKSKVPFNIKSVKAATPKKSHAYRNLLLGSAVAGMAAGTIPLYHLLKRKNMADPNKVKEKVSRLVSEKLFGTPIPPADLIEKDNKNTALSLDTDWVK